MKPIPNTNNKYFATENGDIISITSGKEKILSPGKSNNGHGYLQVNIRGSKSIHRLVYQAFKGEIPIGMVISHKDGNMYNNTPDNLLCETQKENLNRKREHGTLDNGFNNSRSKITEQIFNEIIFHLKEGILLQKEIADIYNVSGVFISKIVNGHRYNGLSDLKNIKKQKRWSDIEKQVFKSIVRDSNQDMDKNNIEKIMNKMHNYNNELFPKRSLEAYKHYYRKI